MNCEICKEKPATTKITLSVSSYLYDVCKGCWEDLDKTAEALQSKKTDQT